MIKLKPHQRHAILTQAQLLRDAQARARDLDIALSELVGDFVELAGGDRTRQWQAVDDCTTLKEKDNGELQT